MLAEKDYGVKADALQIYSERKKSADLNSGVVVYCKETLIIQKFRCHT